MTAEAIRERVAYDLMQQVISETFKAIMSKSNYVIWRKFLKDRSVIFEFQIGNEHFSIHRANQRAMDDCSDALYEFRDSQSKRACQSVLTAIRIMETAVHNRLLDCESNESL